LRTQENAENAGIIQNEVDEAGKRGQEIIVEHNERAKRLDNRLINIERVGWNCTVMIVLETMVWGFGENLVELARPLK